MHLGFHLAHFLCTSMCNCCAFEACDFLLPLGSFLYTFTPPPQPTHRKRETGHSGFTALPWTFEAWTLPCVPQYQPAQYTGLLFPFQMKTTPWLMEFCLCDTWPVKLHSYTLTATDTDVAYTSYMVISQHCIGFQQWVRAIFLKLSKWPTKTVTSNLLENFCSLIIWVCEKRYTLSPSSLESLPK